MCADQLEPSLDGVAAPYPFRVHQQQALDALDEAIAAGRNRAWVVLPPGAGKTLVGLEVARRRGRKTIVFGPNTAIQAQWRKGWDSFLPDDRPDLEAQGSRDLEVFFTALTYQSLATFRTDSEIDEEGQERSLLVRLHPNGRKLVDALKDAGDVTLVLDECHHLLEVWGRLLGEMLEELPNVFVLGLTATPPGALTREQAELVGKLFGDAVFDVSIPAVVREGDLAPFAELAWLTTPTLEESEFVASQAERFVELVGQLTNPEFGSIPFFDWIDRRFVREARDDVSWHRLSREEPALCNAALRMHHQELLRLPAGARMLEEHRHAPSADDWVALIDDWMSNHLLKTWQPADQEVVEAVRRALPSVGYQWTRTGIRRGRSPVDRVLARSEAKTYAAVEIVNAEQRNLQHRMRMLVLCDHEYASAVLPADLSGVMAQQAGSAHLALERLVEDPEAQELNPLLVTGSTVGGAPTTLQRLIEFIREEDPGLAGDLAVAWPNATVTSIHGPWKSRQWVGWVTRFFEEGHSQVLVGTRGLLGEGWDARSVTGLIDLTAATTAAAVVQTRGRALRTDPDWPDKVALTWTVVCVTEEHPKGGNDWERFCRKHEGFFGVDADGDIVNGVAHVDPMFSPYAPPKVATFDQVNARMLLRAEKRHEIGELWSVGEEYDDTLVHTVRLLPPTPDAVGVSKQPAPVVMRHRHLDVREARVSPWRPHPLLLAALALAVVLALVGVPWLAAVVTGLVAGAGIQSVVAARRGRDIVRAAARRPSIEQIAYAVADGLHDAGMSPVGAQAVRVEIDEEGEYRCSLYGVAPDVSATFATALDEVVSPMASPRYVLPRWVVDPPPPGARGLGTGFKAATGLLRPTGEVWHSVPTVLGTNGTTAQAFAQAWDRWVGGGAAIYTGSPQGEGVLVTHRGSDPFALTTVLRVHWR